MQTKQRFKANKSGQRIASIGKTQKIESPESYTPIKSQSVKVKGETFIYEYAEVGFEQIAYAEELGYVRDRRLSALSNSVEIDNDFLEFDYKIQLASVLFVPAENGRPIEFEMGAKQSSYDKLKKIKSGEVEKIEACLLDFFMRRGLYRLALSTLKRNSAGTDMLLATLKALQAPKKEEPRTPSYSDPGQLKEGSQEL